MMSNNFLKTLVFLWGMSLGYQATAKVYSRELFEQMIIPGDTSKGRKILNSIQPNPLTIHTLNVFAHGLSFEQFITKCFQQYETKADQGNIHTMQMGGLERKAMGFTINKNCVFFILQGNGFDALHGGILSTNKDGKMTYISLSQDKYQDLLQRCDGDEQLRMKLLRRIFNDELFHLAENKIVDKQDSQIASTLATAYPGDPQSREKYFARKCLPVMYFALMENTFRIPVDGGYEAFFVSAKKLLYTKSIEKILKNYLGDVGNDPEKLVQFLNNKQNNKEFYELLIKEKGIESLAEDVRKPMRKDYEEYLLKRLGEHPDSFGSIHK